MEDSGNTPAAPVEVFWSISAPQSLLAISGADAGCEA
jgi:hypothetical protein